MIFFTHLYTCVKDLVLKLVSYGLGDNCLIIIILEMFKKAGPIHLNKDQHVMIFHGKVSISLLSQIGCINMCNGRGLGIFQVQNSLTAYSELESALSYCLCPAMYHH